MILTFGEHQDRGERPGLVIGVATTRKSPKAGRGGLREKGSRILSARCVRCKMPGTRDLLTNH
jgi:hypothetical protein